MSLAPEEIERRILRVEGLLSLGATKGSIKATLNREFGIKYRQAETYISAALKRMVDTVREDRDELRARSLAFYRSRLVRSETSDRDKIKAQEAIDKLLGLQAPVRKELSGPEGGPVQFSLDHAVQALDRAEQELAGGKPVLPVQPAALPAAEPEGDLQELMRSLDDLGCEESADEVSDGSEVDPDGNR